MKAEENKNNSKNGTKHSNSARRKSRMKIVLAQIKCKRAKKQCENFDDKSNWILLTMRRGEGVCYWRKQRIFLFYSNQKQAISIENLMRKSLKRSRKRRFYFDSPPTTPFKTPEHVAIEPLTMQ